VIARPRLDVPVPDAVAQLQPVVDPREQARLAGVLLSAQARTVKDPQGREEGRQRLHARLCAANKHLARTPGRLHGWADLPGINR
jgi:hypothetical protein